MQDGYSIVVPVYNSALTLPQLITEIDKVLPTLNASYELVLVNDGSHDDSWDVIEALKQKYPWVRGINFMRNYGQHNALLCGIRNAKYGVTITIDDDLQHPPTEIPKLVSKLAEGYDVVYGKPQQEQHGLLRNLASQITKLMLQDAMGTANARGVSSFRVFRTQLRDAFVNYRSPFVLIDVLLTWGTSRFAVVAIPHNPRQVGKSTYTLRKLLIHAINLLTGFSMLPLELASFLGFGLTLLGIILFIYVVVYYFLRGTTAPGFTFLASVVSVFAGAQLFALGIIGEYIARIHFNTMDKPQYVIRDQSESVERD